MLMEVTNSNLLDLDQMRSLRGELMQAVNRASARPETARDELAGIWNSMTDRAGFVLAEGPSRRRRSHLRPALLPPKPLKEEHIFKVHRRTPSS
jgi:hypothetical protein